MGYSWRCSLPKASSIFMFRSSNLPSLSGPKYTFQIPSSISSRPTYFPAQVVEKLTHPCDGRVRGGHGSPPDDIPFAEGSLRMEHEWSSGHPRRHKRSGAIPHTPLTWTLTSAARRPRSCHLNRTVQPWRIMMWVQRPFCWLAIELLDFPGP